MIMIMIMIMIIMIRVRFLVLDTIDQFVSQHLVMVPVYIIWYIYSIYSIV
jgi:hypothetical protein